MREQVKKTALAAAAVGGFYAVLALLGGTCPIRWLTGLSCPGCGMTRALLAALRLDFSAAVRFHPLFWLPPVAAVAYLARAHIPKRAQRAALWTACVLLIAAYLLRLITGSSPDVVAWTPQQGKVYKMFTTFYWMKWI